MPLTVTSPDPHRQVQKTKARRKKQARFGASMPACIEHGRPAARMACCESAVILEKKKLTPHSMAQGPMQPFQRQRTYGKSSLIPIRLQPVVAVAARALARRHAIVQGGAGLLDDRDGRLSRPRRDGCDCGLLLAG